MKLLFARRAESYLTFSLFTITYNFATLVKSEK